jgi:hypothetical protein
MTLCALRTLAIVVFTASLASAQTAPAPAPSAANFDGEWAGSGGIRLVLKADPAGLTGTVMEPAGAGPITIERGSVNGRTATFVTSRSVNGEPVTVTWTAELNDDDTLAVSRLMDRSSAGREGRGAAAGARGRGDRGAGPRAGAGAGRGAGRAGRGRAGGAAPPEAGRGGERGRAGGGERGRAGGGERGRAGDGERGRAGGGRRGGPAARGAGDFGGGFPEILRRVP